MTYKLGDNHIMWQAASTATRAARTTRRHLVFADKRQTAFSPV